MNHKPHFLQVVVFGDLGILVLMALASLVLHTLTNNQYGFHRDELDTLDNARYLAWGYVAYPPPPLSSSAGGCAGSGRSPGTIS